MIEAAEVVKRAFRAAVWIQANGVYPGIPFFIVPAVVALLVMAQLSSGLATSPGAEISQLPLETRISSDEGLIGRGTLLILPTPESFFIRSEGQGLRSVFVAMPPEKLSSNQESIRLSDAGLDVKRLRGVGYPLVLLLEGEHVDEVDLEGQTPRALSRLEIATPLSTWVVFFLLAGVVFGLGASTSFVENPFAEDQ